MVAGIPLGIFHRSNMEIVPNEMGISMGKSKGIPPMKRRHLSIKPSFGPIMGHISHEPGDWNHALLPVTSCNSPPENKHHHTKLSKFKALEVLPKQKTWISSVPRCRWELHLLLFMSHHFSRPQLQVFLSVPAAVLLPACACVSGCAGLIGASETTRGNDGGMRSKAVDGTIFHAPWRCLESVVACFFYIYIYQLLTL